MTKSTLASAPLNEKVIEGDTPTMRLFALLEVISERDQSFTLQNMVDATGLPKPTLHRMLQILEDAGVLQRQGDSRHYSTGSRLRRLAEKLLLNSTLHGARHIILQQLVTEVGESCNITAFSGGDVIYLDRVETAAPLRFYLHPGSRVPAHCSSSGKLFLAQCSEVQRRRLLGHVALPRYTPNTKTDPAQLEVELEKVTADGYAIDDEEYLPGLFCIAVLVPTENGEANLAVAIQAPVTRLHHADISRVLPALHRAACALAAVESDKNS
jgi:IclR family acetate operon transcriptional repressor